MSRAWMPLYVADYLADTGHLSPAEHGAYLLLIMHYWSNGGLPNDDRKLCRIARMSIEEWDGSRDTIADFFESEWTHKRIDQELFDAKEAYERRANAGRKGGKATQEAKQCSSNAQAMPPAMFKQSQSQSHILSSNEDNTREATPLAVLSECLSEQTAKDVIEHRKKLRKPMTSRAARELSKSFISYGNPEAAAAAMIANGWQGFNPIWLDNQNNRTGPPKAQNGKTGGWAMLSMKLKEYENETQNCSLDTPVLELPDYGRAIS